MVEYWIWLQQVLGFGSTALRNIISEYGNAYNFYNAPTEEKIKKAYLTKIQADKLNAVPRRVIKEIINECRSTGIDIITPDDELYPKRLQEIPNPPAVLYVKGEMPNIDDEVVITMVGPRKPSDYGAEKAFELSRSLTFSGCLILSGGAMGIDSASHFGALSAGGKTVAVLGSGINSDYLKSNAKLRKKISEHGCLISEYPPQYQASRYTFPQRNRLMSALSLGVTVIEAPIKSGSLITAEYAAEQGKDVFVIPGSPDSNFYKGSNRLLRDGAKPLIEPLDILEEYANDYPDKIDLEKITESAEGLTLGKFIDKIFGRSDKPKEKKINIFSKITEKFTKSADVSVLSADAQKIYKTANEDFCADELVEPLGVSITEVQSAIMELELSGIVKSVPGGRYKILK